MDKPTISMIVTHNQPLIMAGFNAVAGMGGFDVLGEATSATACVDCYNRLQPDILLIDLDVPGSIDAITSIRKLHNDAKVIVLTAHDGDEHIHRAFQAGASSYLLKQAAFEEIVHCFRQVASNGRYLAPQLAEKLSQRLHGNALSRRELDILAHLSTGKSNKVIARDAGIGVGTVKYHVNNILSKLNVRCRTEAAHVGRKRGLLHTY